MSCGRLTLRERDPREWRGALEMRTCLVKIRMVDTLCGGEAIFRIVYEQIGNTVDQALGDILVEQATEFYGFALSSVQLHQMWKRILTFGKEKPTFLASLIPVFQDPPPMVLPRSSTPYSELGSPRQSQIR